MMSRTVIHPTRGLADGMHRQSPQVAERAETQAAKSARRDAEVQRAKLEAEAARARWTRPGSARPTTMPADTGTETD